MEDPITIAATTLLTILSAPVQVGLTTTPTTPTTTAAVIALKESLVAVLPSLTYSPVKMAAVLAVMAAAMAAEMAVEIVTAIVIVAIDLNDANVFYR